MGTPGGGTLALEDALLTLQKQLSAQPELLNRLQLLQDAIRSRERRDTELQSLIGSKDADIVRLRGEINRMRHAVTQATELNSAHAAEVHALQTQLQQAQTGTQAVERAAVLRAAVPAATTPAGQLAALQCQLDVQCALTARCEAEGVAAAAAASARLQELQDSFAAKVADMRRSHQEALAAVEARVVAAAGAGAQGAVRAAQTEAAAARQQASAAQDQQLVLGARLEALQAAVARLSQQLEERAGELAEVQAGRDAALRRAVAAEADAGQARADLGAARQEATTLQETITRLQGGAETGAGSEPGAGQGVQAGGAAVEMQSMLGMMEGQLQRLSELVRARDAEVLELRRAIQAACEERRDLTRQLEASSAQATAAPVAGQQHAAGLGGHHLPSSPTGSGAGAPRLIQASGTSKPYRTGLVSKPKFK